MASQNEAPYGVGRSIISLLSRWLSQLKQTFAIDRTQHLRGGRNHVRTQKVGHTSV